MSQASVVLTIDKNRLRDLWLPSISKDGDALEYMYGICVEAAAGSERTSFEHLNRAYCALMRRWDAGVETVRERGGLLLIGGKF